MNERGNCYSELIQNSQFLNSGHTSGFGVLLATLFALALFFFF